VDITKLFLELASHDRINILKILDKEKKRLTSIAEEIDETVQETYRNLIRLIRAKLIDKDKEGYYTLTPFGRYILMILPTIEFLCENREYLLTHDLSKIPKQFIHRISALKNSKRAPDTLTALQYIELLIRESKEYIWTITEQILASKNQEIIQKTKEVLFKIILPDNFKPPPGITINFKMNRNIDIRYIQSIDVALILNERRACLAFPWINGEIDYKGFLIEDKDGYEWCKDLFQYYWKKSRFLPQ